VGLSAPARATPILAVVMAALVAACSGAPGASSSGAQHASQGSTDSSVAVAASLEADGLGHSQAIFIAATSGTVKQSGPNVFELVETFPIGNGMTDQLTIVPHRAAPQPGQEVQATYANDDAGFHFHLDYFVPYEGMPDDVRRAIDDGRLGSTSVTLAAFHDTRPGDWGVEVLQDGVVTKVFEEAIESSLKDQELEEKLPPGELTNSFKIYKAVNDAIAAFSAMQEYRKEMADLDALESCARNPKNPLVINTFKNDPAQQQKVLDLIAEARSEAASNTAVIFAGQAIKQLPSLVGWAVDVEGGSGAGTAAGKVIGFVVSPVVKWSNSLLTTLSRAGIADVGKALNGCEDFGGQCTEPSPTPTPGVSRGDTTPPPVSTPQPTSAPVTVCAGGQISGDITETIVSSVVHTEIHLHVVGRWTCETGACDWDLADGTFEYDSSYHKTCTGLTGIESEEAHGQGKLQGATNADALVLLGDQGNGVYLLGGQMPVVFDRTSCGGSRSQATDAIFLPRCPSSSSEVTGKVVMNGGLASIDFTCTGHEPADGGTEVTVSGVLTTTLPYPPPETVPED
jgi:hypothetical protein